MLLSFGPCRLYCALCGGLGDLFAVLERLLAGVDRLRLDLVTIGPTFSFSIRVEGANRPATKPSAAPASVSPSGLRSAVSFVLSAPCWISPVDGVIPETRETIESVAPETFETPVPQAPDQLAHAALPQFARVTVRAHLGRHQTLRPGSGGVALASPSRG